MIITVYVHLYLKKVGEKKYSNVLNEQLRFFSFSLFRVFSHQFFLIEDVYLIAFSKILSENIQNEKKNKL